MRMSNLIATTFAVPAATAGDATRAYSVARRRVDVPTVVDPFITAFRGGAP
jgi:hypothetical protein